MKNDEEKEKKDRKEIGIMHLPLLSLWLLKPIKGIHLLVTDYDSKIFGKLYLLYRSFVDSKQAYYIGILF